MPNLFRGTAILSIGSFISKIIGILYVIPFYVIIGGEANAALYQYGYVPYTIFLSIGTAGIPLAISKYISHYNSLNQFENSQKLFRASFYIMLITGILSFLAMYLLAPIFGQIQATKGVFSADQIAYVIKATSFALIFIPIMSLFRGYFQGHYEMLPTSMSQIIEQISRVIFLLCSTFIILHVLKGDMTIAISFATFSACIGALFSLGYLVYKYYKQRKQNAKKGPPARGRGQITVSYSRLFKEIILSAVPFVLVGIAFSLYQQIDLLSFSKILVHQGVDPRRAVDLLSIVNFSTQKLIMIPNTFSLSFSMSIIPLFASYFIKKEFNQMNKQFSKIIQSYFLITLPICIFMCVLSYPLYYCFYGDSVSGGRILALYVMISVIISFFSVATAILQGINGQLHTVFALVLGLVSKIIFQYPLMALFHEYGAILATGLGYTFSILYILYAIKRLLSINFGVGKRLFLLILIINFVFVWFTFVVYWITTKGIAVDSRMTSFAVLAIVAMITFSGYIFFCLKTKLFKRVIR